MVKTITKCSINTNLQMLSLLLVFVSLSHTARCGVPESVYNARTGKYCSNMYAQEVKKKFVSSYFISLHTVVANELFQQICC